MTGRGGNRAGEKPRSRARKLPTRRSKDLGAHWGRRQMSKGVSEWPWGLSPTLAPLGKHLSLRSLCPKPGPDVIPTSLP